MQIKLNNLSFDVVPVATGLRDVLLTDPILIQGVHRDVWRWDHSTQTGTTLVATTQQKGVPLPNGISFFVPKAGANGVIRKADAPSAKMATRFLEAVNGKSILDVMQALNRIVNLPQKKVPTDVFAPLNPFASYTLTSHIDYAVVQLAHTARNLSAYFFVPGQVSFTHRVTEIADQGGLDALIAKDPKMAIIQPAFIIPPNNQANMMLRRMAMVRRLNDLQETLGGKVPVDLDLTDPRRLTAARLTAEWRVLQPQAKVNA